MPGRETGDFSMCEVEVFDLILAIVFFYLDYKYISEFSPFALGGFMMLSTDKFKEIGKFNEDVLVAEDYLLSRKIKPNRFEIANITAFTTPRRYEKKSVWYMLKLVFKSYINRNNLDYFKKDHNYWV